MNLRTLLALALLAAPLVRPAAAQCPPVPDGLDLGTACGGAQANLPVQHAFGQQALGLCWTNCSMSAQANYIVKWGQANPSQPVLGAPPSCAWHDAQLRIYTTGGTLLWGGNMQLTYSRTWFQGSTAGAVSQVWRYLVNGDLRPTTNTATPCGTPPCATSFGNRVRFTGYVDYSFDCGSSLTEHAWMLTHACDAIDHVIGFPRGGVYHPGRSYTFVGPAAGFVPGAGAGNETGTGTLEAMRHWDAPALPSRCGVEEPLISGTIAPGAPTCPCGAGPANWYQGQLTLLGSFGSVLFPFPGSDPFRSFAVGQWTNPLAFPGVQELRWNCNEGQWVRCSGLGRQDFYYGVTTIGGFPAFSFNASSPSVPLPPTFIDQSNSVNLPAGTSTRNRPYRSDHIFNLNL